MKCFSMEKKAAESALFVLAVFFFFGILTSIVISDTSIHATTQTASQTVGPNSISMSSDDSVAIAVVPTSEQTIYTGINTLSVTNSCTSGATITLTTNSNSDTALANNLVRSGSDELTKEIGPTTGSSLINNSWGYSVNGGTNYYAVPAKDQTPATIYSSNSATSGTDTVNVKYGIKMNHDLPSGTYSNDVIYTVAVKPECLSYTLKWDLDGGTGKTGANYDDTQMTYGSNIDLTNYTPTREGFTFKGWSDGSSTFTGNETSVNINESNARMVTLTAQWEADVFKFSYTGSAQTWRAPYDGNYRIELWGASGHNDSAGAYVSGELTVNSGSTLYVYVGQQGYHVRGGANTASPAYNGGGVSGSQCHTSTTYGGYSMGGGSTDIRITSGSWDNASSLNSRIMVAGAGGASGGNQVDQNGAGGGLTGYDGIHRNSYYGTGASQTSGGSINGSFGKGGNGQNNNDSCNYDGSGGGGGGWYGGGGSRTNGSNTWSQGGGGSSYISGHTGAVGVTSTSSSSPKSGCTTGTTSIACSLTPYVNPATNTSYTFVNTTMIDGAGYSWTNTIGSLSAMPNPSGGNYASGVGHIGDGYARITYLGND